MSYTKHNEDDIKRRDERLALREEFKPLTQTYKQTIANLYPNAKPKPEKPKKRYSGYTLSTRGLC